jgi:hypothetical protein
MLHQYVNQKVCSIESLKKSVEKNLHESLNYLQALESEDLPMGDLFQCRVAELESTIESVVKMAEKEDLKIQRFIDISLKKLGYFGVLYQTVIKMIYFINFNLRPSLLIKEKSDEGDTPKKKLLFKPVPKSIKIDRSSNLNVIQTQSDFIEIGCHNKSMMTHETTYSDLILKKSPISEEKDYSPFVDTIIEPIRILLSAFELETHKMSIYIVRYHNIGHTAPLVTIVEEKIKPMCLLITRELEKESTDLLLVKEQSFDHLKQRFNQITELFSRMVELIKLEKTNAFDYIFNNITRFIECNEMFQKMLHFVHSRGLSLEIIKNYDTKENTTQPNCEKEQPLSSMY